jgi:hypothetical protein
MGEELDRSRLPWDLASTIARASVDLSLPRPSLIEALRAAIANRGGYFSFDEDDRGCVVWLK